MASVGAELGGNSGVGWGYQALGLMVWVYTEIWIWGVVLLLRLCDRRAESEAGERAGLPNLDLNLKLDLHPDLNQDLV